VKANEIGRACSIQRREEECIQGFTPEPEGNRLLETPRRRWENNIKMDVRVTGWDGMDYFHLVQDRYQRKAFVNTVMNIPVLLSV
jgi:hypothetical protein